MLRVVWWFDDYNVVFVVLFGLVYVVISLIKKVFGVVVGLVLGNVDIDCGVYGDIGF